VLGVLLRLVLVEERHNLTHHHAHRVIAEFLRDRHEPHTVLGQAADIKFKLKLVAEEARERMDDDRVEGRWAGSGCVHHLLKLRTSIIRR